MRKKCVNENEADKTRFIKGEKKIKVVKKVYKSLIRDKKSRMQKIFKNVIFNFMKRIIKNNKREIFYYKLCHH